MTLVIKITLLLLISCLSFKTAQQANHSDNIDFSHCDEIFCYRDPPGCDLATCKYGVTIESDGTLATIFLTTNASGMVALGFSDDRNMGEDDVVGCYRDSASTIKVVDAWNPGNYYAPNRLDAINNLDTSAINGTYSQGILQCKIVRNLTTTDTSEDRDWKSLWYLLYPYSTNTGPGLGGALSPHSSRPVRSEARINISAPRLVTEAPTLLSTSPASTQGSPRVDINFDNCENRFCYRDPSGCTSETCTYGVTIDITDSKAVIKFTTTQGGMIALGFSDDRSMGEDDVVGCYRESGGAIKFVDAWNPGGYTPNRPDKIANLDTTQSIGSYSNGVLQCQVVRDLTTSDTSEDRDWTKPWYHLYPYSTNTGPGGGNALPPHSARPVRSEARINISPSEKPTSSASHLTLAISQGVLIAMAWVVVRLC